MLRPQFTSKERDAETGFDYFGARYMSSAQGRFTSPDPEVIPRDITNPQVWNKYAYVSDNPLRLIDPDGHQPIDANVQKMLELLRAPASKASGAIKGGLIQYAIENTVNYALGEMFGYPSRAVRGNLSIQEKQFLDQVSSFERGALMLGVGQRNAPGIDAVDLDNVAGISLKSASNAANVGRNAEDALESVQKAGFHNVQVYIDASNISKSDATGLTKVQGVLGDGRVTKVIVFTRDGTVTDSPTKEQQRQIQKCKENEGGASSCQ